jgi:hypothetical protein
MAAPKRLGVLVRATVPWCQRLGADSCGTRSMSASYREIEARMRLPVSADGAASLSAERGAWHHVLHAEFESYGQHDHPRNAGYSTVARPGRRTVVHEGA